MKLFGFNITRAQTPAPPTTQKSLSPAALAWLAGGPEPDRSPLLSDAFQQVVWVYRAVTALAEQIANVPFLFSRGERGREHLITSGPLFDFYSRPGPALNHFQYWELRVLWLLLRGECFRLPIFRDSQGNHFLSSGAVFRSVEPPPSPSACYSVACQAQERANASLAAGHSSRKLSHILFLDPQRIQPTVKDHTLLGWRYTDPNPQSPAPSQLFLPEEVWFDKFPNPFNPWRGLSPLLVADLAAKTDFAASAYMRGLIDNNAENGLIVRTDQQLSDEQHEQIAAALRNRKRRAGTPDSSILLWGVNEIVHPHLSSADLQFLENRKFTRAEICAAFGVPEEIVTTTDHNKYDVMQGARLNFIENRVAPLCARLEAAEQVTVKTIDPSALGWFDLDSLPIMQQARRNRLAAAKAGFDMGIPFNELNRVLDLGFKPLPWGDRGYLASQLRQISETP